MIAANYVKNCLYICDLCFLASYLISIILWSPRYLTNSTNKALFLIIIY